MARGRSWLARRRMGLARGGARGSGSRYRTRCPVVLRRLRLFGLRLWLWDRLRLPSLWLRHDDLRLWLRLQLPGLRVWLWYRLQLPRLWLWLWQGHCPPRSLCRRRRASLALKGQTKASRRILAEERLL